MSLINDALKRANETNPGPGRTPPEKSAPMRPAETPPNHQSVGLPRYFFPVLLCVFGGACWFLVHGWDARRHAGMYPEPTKAVIVQARETPPESASAESAARPEVDPELATESLPVPEGRRFTLDNSASEAMPAPAPAYRLQGIFYRPSNPAAVINKRTVFVGDIISGARVKVIDHRSVTLELNGETRMLEIE